MPIPEAMYPAAGRDLTLARSGDWGIGTVGTQNLVTSEFLPHPSGLNASTTAPGLDGFLYAAVGSGSISRFSLQNNTWSPYLTLAPAGVPGGLGVDGTGKVYLAGSGNTLKSYIPGSSVPSAQIQPAGSASTIDLSLSPAGIIALGRDNGTFVLTDTTMATSRQVLLPAGSFGKTFTTWVPAITQPQPGFLTDATPGYALVNTPWSWTPPLIHPDPNAILTLAAVALPSWMQLNGLTLTGTPLTAQAGSNIMRLTVRDSSGRTSTRTFNFPVAASNTPPSLPPSLPAINATGNAAPGEVDLTSYLFDPDAGDPVRWSITGNTNPALFASLTINSSGRLSIQYATLAAGQATLTLEARDYAGTIAVTTLSIDLPAVPIPEITTQSALVLNPQTGLWEQQVIIKNIGLRAIAGFEIHITGLPTPAVVYNASDSQPSRFVVGYHVPVQAVDSISLLLEYQAPEGFTLNPVLTTVIIPPRPAPPAELVIDRAVMLEPGVFVLEFPSIPGQLYQVQYGNGLTWTNSQVRLRAAGHRVQWIDRGAPRTNSPPGTSSVRFYRIKRILTP